jgi:hypothetical protein
MKRHSHDPADFASAVNELKALAIIAADPSLLTDEAANAARALIAGGSDMSADLQAMLAARDERQSALNTLRRLGGLT